MTRAARPTPAVFDVDPALRDLDTPEDAQALATHAALPPAIHAIVTSASEPSCQLT